MTQLPRPETFPEQAPSCDHARARLVRRQNRNTVVVAVRQCLRCGRSLRQVPRAELAAGIDSLPRWDEALVTSWRGALDAYHERHRLWWEGKRDRENAAWRERYNEHLRSPEWAALRRKVFARCGGLCEGCGERRAVQVHHLTYDRLGAEMLFDLAAVCVTCHESIHAERS